MTNFIVYVEQLEYEEYEVVVEAKSIKSVEEEWEGVRDGLVSLSINGQLTIQVSYNL